MSPSPVIFDTTRFVNTSPNLLVTEIDKDCAGDVSAEQTVGVRQLRIAADINAASNSFIIAIVSMCWFVNPGHRLGDNVLKQVQGQGSYGNNRALNALNSGHVLEPDDAILGT